MSPQVSKVTPQSRRGHEGSYGPSASEDQQKTRQIESSSDRRREPREKGKGPHCPVSAVSIDPKKGSSRLSSRLSRGCDALGGCSHSHSRASPTGAPKQRPFSHLHGPTSFFFSFFKRFKRETRPFPFGHRGGSQKPPTNGKTKKGVLEFRFVSWPARGIGEYISNQTVQGRM
ncbi:hypothetical protein VTN96DRAFT_382 [Rasamsonia emersonii]